MEGGSRRLRAAIYASHKLPVVAGKGGVIPEAEPHGASCDFQCTGGYVCLFSLRAFSRGKAVWKHRAAQRCGRAESLGQLRACQAGEARGPLGAPQVRTRERRGGCPPWPPAPALLEKLPRFGFKKGQNQLNKCMAVCCNISVQFRLIVHLQWAQRLNLCSPDHMGSNSKEIAITVMITIQ